MEAKFMIYWFSYSTVMWLIALKDISAYNRYESFKLYSTFCST